MGSVELVEKTLPLNDMIHYVYKDADLRERWLTDLKGVCDEFGLSDEEYQALKDVDVKCLMEIGTHQYPIPHILRLLEDGDHDKMLRECTLEVMEEAGSGGTAELISWFFAFFLLGGPPSCVPMTKFLPDGEKLRRVTGAPSKNLRAG